MRFGRTNQFERSFRRLSSEDKRRVAQALERFSKDPLHPSLHTEKLTNAGNVWSFRASLRLRCTFEWDGSLGGLRTADYILLRNVGGHEVYR